MSNTSYYAGVHIPGGCTVFVGDDEASLVDIGVIPIETDTNIEITYDKVKVQGSKRELISSYVKNMKAKAATEIYQIRLDIINKLTGGVMNLNSIAGSIINDENFTVKPGWDKGQLYILPGQNSNGNKQTITSIIAGSKTLAEGTDYIQSKDASGRWGIVVLAASTALTTANLNITYSYTPATAIKASMGSANVSISPKVVRFLLMQEGKKFQVTLFAALMEGGIKLSFPGVDNDKPATLPISIEGDLDSNRAEGSQLLDIIDEIGVN
ncbi:MAG: hypothetical protein ACPKNR_13280 [Pleomorphochaeta sp.]